MPGAPCTPSPPNPPRPPARDPGAEVTSWGDDREHREAKLRGRRATQTQIEVDGPFVALSNNVGQQAMGIEHYILARGERHPREGRESDLFGGVEG